MAKRKRVTRKQLLKEPDEFLTFSARAIRFVSNNQKPVFGVMIGVVVAILVFAGFRYFSNLSERQAYRMFEQARLQYLAEISEGKTDPNQDKTAEQFEKVIRKYPSTSAARFSLLVYADMSYRRGDYQKAIELYQKALGAFSGEGSIQELILDGLAYAYEAKKDYKSAAECFQRVADSQDEFMKADACYNLGRIMEALNDKEKALAAYNKVVQAYPDSVGFEIAKEKVLHLKGASATLK
jgi:predicted negative regulator of RcsB-dependent stress response